MVDFARDSERPFARRLCEYLQLECARRESELGLLQAEAVTNVCIEAIGCAVAGMNLMVSDTKISNESFQSILNKIAEELKAVADPSD